MAEALKLRMILNLVFIGPFYGGIVEIGVLFLGIGPSKHPPAILHASGSDK